MDESLSSTTKVVPLTRGYVAIVSAEDFDRVMAAGKWYACVDRRPDGTVRNVYAMRKVRHPDGSRTTLMLHRLVLGVDDPKNGVDHINHSGLDNRRDNLRVATQTGNNANSRKQVRKTSSQYKGVTWNKQKVKWQAQIQVGKARRWLGLFNSEMDAAKKYDAAAIAVRGSFAKTNVSIEELVAAA